MLQLFHMFSITIKLDIEKDAWNWWDACNSVSYGVNWKERIDPEVAEKLLDTTQEKAFEFLIPYLEKKYRADAEGLETTCAKMQDIFDARGNAALRRMEEITGKPLYRNDFTCFLTTFPRCPYDYQKGYIYVCTLWPVEDCLDTLLHEVQHFQFYAYYQQLPEVRILTKSQREDLKEALTVILNHEFAKFMYQDDKGYAPHQKLRKKLEAQWKKEPDFEKLVRFGAGLV